MSQSGKLPRITVVTPSLNQGRYLRESIESVLAQNYPNLEFFIIDAGSTDESLSVIKSFESHIDYWVSEPDGGQSDGINKGFMQATGELVAWLNADDYYLPGAFEKVLEIYLSDPSAPFYFGDGLRVSENGSLISNFFPHGVAVFSRQALVMGLNYILQPSAFINRWALEQVGYLNTSLHYGMDSDLWMRLSAVGTPKGIPSVLSATREYTGTKTASGSFKRIEELRQVSLKHSGMPVTPGVLCYMLDTLYRFAQENEDVFPLPYLSDIAQFWQKSAELLAQYRAGIDGFPLETKTMKIGIDIRPLIIGASGGISQLVKGVCEQMFMLYPTQRFLIFCTPFNKSLFEYVGDNVHYFTLPLDTYFVNLDEIAEIEQIDVLFRAYPMEDSLQYPLNKQIVLIPDNQHETYPEFFKDEVLRSRRAAFAKALAGAGAIGTISKFARKMLLEYSGTRCRDIFLMPPSLQVAHESGASDSNLSEAEKRLIPDGDFFLFPANLWKHKNHRCVLNAFRLFLEKRKSQIEFVLTGHPEGWSELSAEFADLPVRHLGFVRPELLRALLQRARALVFFSLYEGFGIPLLEAFNAGTPVICSNTTSLPEVGGDAVFTCSPTDIEAMARLMEQVLADAELRATLVQRGQHRLKAYSWEKSANSLIEAFARVSRKTSGHELAEAELNVPRPLVSIVTPSFNQGRFLKRTIESVLSQNYSNIEYLVIDGGSTDESIEILRSYGDRFTWVSEKDNGQTHAINKGMERAHGEILAYLNSDDVLLPGAIVQVVRFFQEHPECEMVYGNADYIDEDDQFIKAYNTADFSLERLMQDCMVCQPAAFWRSSVAERIGSFDEQLNFVMDYDYWIRIAKSGSVICFIPVKLACSRLYPQTKTLSQRAKIYSEIFQISTKHVGYVHLNFYKGYWHHLIFEKNAIISRLTRIVPYVYLPFAWVHHTWNHRQHYAWDRFAAVFRRKTIKVLSKFGLKPILLKVRNRLRSNHVGKNNVIGYRHDNWLADKVIVPPKQHAAGQSLHIAGVAPQNTTMTIYSGENELMQHEFLAHQYDKVSFPSESVEGQTVQIQFSNYATEASGRRLGFLLQDTNIFAEQDTW